MDFLEGKIHCVNVALGTSSEFLGVLVTWLLGLIKKRNEDCAISLANFNISFPLLSPSEGLTICTRYPWRTWPAGGCL